MLLPICILIFFIFFLPEHRGSRICMFYPMRKAFIKIYSSTGSNLGLLIRVHMMLDMILLFKSEDNYNDNIVMCSVKKER